MKVTFVAVLAAAALLPAAIAVSATSPSPQPDRPVAASRAGAEAPRPVDLNKATIEELIAIPGIGERLAQSIVELRRKKGSFASVDELLEIRGIGEKSIKLLAAHLIVGPSQTAAAPAPAVNPTR
jgi:competence protein ComEA